MTDVAAPALPAPVEALRQLVDVARPEDVPMLTELLRRLEDDRLRILVVGEAKRGKSTLVNALLDTTIMPTGVVPVTALATTVVYGPAERVEVALDGQLREVPVSELAAYITEKANPDNRLGVVSVTVHLPAELLKDGVELVDTPGTGSVHEHNTREAQTALRDIDVGVLVLTADAPMSAAERELLTRMVDRRVHLFCVLNKVDYLSGDDLTTAMEFVTEQLSSVTHSDDPLFLCAARNPGDAGVRALRSAIETHLRQGRRSAQLGTVAHQAGQVARATAAELDVTARVLALHEQSNDERVALFSERLARISDRAGSAGRVVEALAGDVLARLNRDAEQAERDVSRVLDQRLTALFEGELATASAAETEERARAAALEVVRPWLDAWRETAADQVVAGVEGVAARLTTDLATDLADLRAAASELLGVDLDLAEITIEVPEDHRFFYTLQPVPMQTELMAGAVRRRLPGALGRRHAQDYVRQEMGRIARAQVGRIRADLQQRLGESGRQLRRSVQEQHRDSIARMAAAVSAAESVRRGTHDEVTAARAGLEHRRAVLARALSVLDASVS